MEVEKQSHFAIVNMKTATTAAVSVGFFSYHLLSHTYLGARRLQRHFNVSLQLLVLSQVDRVLDEVDWLIARKKSQTAAAKCVSGKKLFILMFCWRNGERREEAPHCH